MSLSIDKLQEIAGKQGFHIKNIFTKHNYCRFIEFYSIPSQESFIITISDDYKFKYRDGLELKSLYLDERDNIPEKYAKLPDNIDMLSFYDEIELQQLVKMNGNSVDFEKKMIDGYTDITVGNMTNKNTEDIRENINQLKRFLNCVKNLKYKISLIHKIWLINIDSNGIIDCYLIKDFIPNKMKYLYVTMDIETFLTNINTISDDIGQIHQGIKKVVNKNMGMMNTKVGLTNQVLFDFNNSIYRINLKRGVYETYLLKFQKMLETVEQAEKKLDEKYELFKANTSNRLYSDIDKARERSLIEEDLSRLSEHKKEIITHILNIKEKDRYLMLVTDTIIFESVIMLNTVIENIRKLNEITK